MSQNDQTQSHTGKAGAVDINAEVVDTEAAKAALGQEINSSRTSTRIGALLTIVGIALTAFGLGGNLDFGISIPGLSANLSNASPGAFILLLGVILLLQSRPNIKIGR